MDLARRVELIKLDGAALADAAETDLGARIPTCPEWDMAELVRHILQVHGSWSLIVDDGRMEPAPLDITIRLQPDLPVVGALRGSASDLLLGLWKRLPIETVEATGDVASIADAIATIDFA